MQQSELTASRNWSPAQLRDVALIRANSRNNESNNARYGHVRVRAS